MKYILFVSLFFLAGCSTCDWQFDPFGNASGHCYAYKWAKKLCADRGGIRKSRPVHSLSFMCDDGTVFEGYKNDWKEVKK